MLEHSLRNVLVEARIIPRRWYRGIGRRVGISRLILGSPAPGRSSFYLSGASNAPVKFPAARSHEPVIFILANWRPEETDVDGAVYRVLKKKKSFYGAKQINRISSHVRWDYLFRRFIVLGIIIQGGVEKKFIHLFFLPYSNNNKCFFFFFSQ